MEKVLNNPVNIMLYTYRRNKPYTNRINHNPYDTKYNFFYDNRWPFLPFMPLENYSKELEKLSGYQVFWIKHLRENIVTCDANGFLLSQYSSSMHVF